MNEEQTITIMEALYLKYKPLSELCYDLEPRMKFGNLNKRGYEYACVYALQEELTIQRLCFAGEYEPVSIPCNGYTGLLLIELKSPLKQNQSIEEYIYQNFIFRSIDYLRSI